jgi:hypothetical protein
LPPAGRLKLLKFEIASAALDTLPIADEILLAVPFILFNTPIACTWADPIDAAAPVIVDKPLDKLDDDILDSLVYVFS